MTSEYIINMIKLFAYYKMLGEKAIVQVPEEKLSWQYNPDSNSITTIIKHLSGNMLSRWTELLTTDGEKEWRNRDAEFENDIKSRVGLMTHWSDGWKCLFETLESLTTADLGKEIFIRNQGQTVMEAINRQLAHYSYHIGQIVFMAKMICGPGWTSLSIPKGNSSGYNAAKFAKPKQTEHFTDDFINNKIPEDPA